MAQRTLGISVYPDIRPLEEITEYMALAVRYGAARVFSSMFSVEGTDAEVTEYFHNLIAAAHKVGLEVSLDVNPACLKRFCATENDLTYFYELGVDVLRMDVSGGLDADLQLVNNPYNIKIELNASGGITPDYIQGLVDRGANKERISVCHNFYPQRYTGMKWDPFCAINRAFKECGVRVSAFISSNAPNTHGVWDATCGLCTVEKLRGLPIDLQMRRIFATDDVDDVLIGNAYATEEEFKLLWECLNRPIPTPNEKLAKIMTSFGVSAERPNAPIRQLRLHLEPDITPTEEDILFNFFPHSDIGDSSEWMWRSRMPRFVYQDESITPKLCSKPFFLPGDVVMVNNNYKHYAGEVQIVLLPMENDGQRNLVGTLHPEEFAMLEQIKPMDTVIFIKEKYKANNYKEVLQ